MDNFDALMERALKTNKYRSEIEETQGFLSPEGGGLVELIATAESAITSGLQTLKGNFDESSVNCIAEGLCFVRDSLALLREEPDILRVQEVTYRKEK